MKESLTVETKFGPVEVNPRFEDDGTLFALINAKGISINRVDVRGTVRMVLRDKQEGWQPWVDSSAGGRGFDSAALYATYLTRMDSHKDASTAQRINLVKELQRVLTDIQSEKDFKEVVRVNSKDLVNMRDDSLQDEIEKLEAKLAELKRKQHNRAGSKSVDRFKLLGI